jgi:predicted DNA-binding WGR domain protein
VLENLNPLSRKALAPLSKGDAVVKQLAAALRRRGYAVDLHVGQSKFRCDLAVRSDSDSLYQLGILVDTDGHYANPNLLDRYLMQPSILRAFGWRFALVLTKDWYHNPDDVLARLEKLLRGQDAGDGSGAEDKEAGQPTTSGFGSAARMPLQHETDGSPEKSSVAQQESTLKRAEAGAPVAGREKTADILESPPVPTTVRGSSSVRRFEFIGGASRKFWEISLSGDSFTVRFGRIGTAGQSQTKTFADEAKAKREAESLIAEKLRKGYVEG